MRHLIVIRARRGSPQFIAVVSSNRPGHDLTPSAFRASSLAFCAFTIDDLTTAHDDEFVVPVLALVDGGRELALAALTTAIARRVAPLFLGALPAGLAGGAARSSVFFKKGLGRFSTSLKSYCGGGACASAATAAAAEVALVDADDDELCAAEADAARMPLGRDGPEEDDAVSVASAERMAADAEDARIEGRRSLVGRTGGTVPVLDVDAELVVLPVLFADCVGVIV